MIDKNTRDRLFALFLDLEKTKSAEYCAGFKHCLRQSQRFGVRETNEKEFNDEVKNDRTSTQLK